MTEKVTVNLGERSYDILIGNGMPVASALAPMEGVSALVVSDSNVGPLYAEKCEQSLIKMGMSVVHAQVPAGEDSKDGKFVAELYTKALEGGLDRRSVIVALGGGVVGDLSGFVAATYLRGVRLIQVPTTLLAMVDSSVGGKTGINMPEGKNLVGSFYQPIEVVMDLSTLETLPEKEYVSGLAEVVKYGAIWDAELLSLLEDEADAILAHDSDLLARVIKRCCEIKAEVVGDDEKESGLRTILNFGHTLGHAIEKVMGYGACTHGEAVSVGMAYAARLSVDQAGLSKAECDRLAELLQKLGLPTSIADVNGGDGLAWDDLRSAMSSDKKAEGTVPRWVLIERLASAQFGVEVDEKAMENAL